MIPARLRTISLAALKAVLAVLALAANLGAAAPASASLSGVAPPRPSDPTA